MNDALEQAFAFAFWHDIDRIPDRPPAKAAELLAKVEAPALEVGCGKGRILAMAPAGTIGVDFSRTALKELKARGLRNDVVQAEATHLPFVDGAFKTAYTHEVLMHVKDADGVVREMGRIASKTVAVENTHIKDRLLIYPHDWQRFGIEVIENL